MNQSIFNCLSSLPNISTRLYNNITRLVNGNRVIDLLLHSPVSVVHRLNTPKLNIANPGEIVTISAKILNHIPSTRKRTPHKVICSTCEGELTIIFFNFNKYYIQKILPIDQEKVISGKITKFATISHPDYIVNNLSDIKAVEPIYPLTHRISNKILIKSINNALTLLPEIPEWIDATLINKNQWSSWKKSILNLHNPKDMDSLVKNKERLACDEFLAYQLQLQNTRNQNTQSIGKIIKGNGSLRRKLIQKLPFKLTAGQQKVIKEIIQDQAQPQRMMRLLQGDVGSGKTIVALFAILNAVECATQVAFMVPTEVLATQHANWIQSIIGDCVKIRLLTGKMKISEKRTIESELINGEIKILIGTHTLFQDKLRFKALALVVIDEQHRFGVQQRAKLFEKGGNVDTLLMSATPIPRTLNLAIYGDIDSSILDEKPANRLAIKTSVIHKKNIGSVIERIEHVLRISGKIYWVCPLIEESEKIDMMAVVHRFNQLSEVFNKQVGLVHGKMKPTEREEAILKFKNDQTSILVATTVIEVGIDIPDANIMIIENAERFGLSQLHQLRGRVGRNNKKSFCILLYENTSKITHKRLQVIRDSNNGFYIAEQDLKIRGSGEMIGYKQSGLPNFKFVDLQGKNDNLMYIHSLAKKITASDKNLENNECFKILVKIFNKDNSSFI